MLTLAGADFSPPLFRPFCRIDRLQELFDPPSRRLDPALETALEPLHDITPSVSDFSRGNLGRWRTETFGPPLLKPAQTRFESISEFFGIQKIVRITGLEDGDEAVRSFIEMVFFRYHSGPRSCLNFRRATDP